jgi:hypothetical protein
MRRDVGSGNSACRRAGAELPDPPSAHYLFRIRREDVVQRLTCSQGETPFHSTPFHSAVRRQLKNWSSTILVILSAAKDLTLDSSPVGLRMTF